MYPLPLVKRVKGFWDSFKSWLSENFPEALETLAKGVSEFDITKAERDLCFELSIATKVLYRFCNGQMHDGQDLASCGILGGYEIKFDNVSVQLLPLKKIVRTTRLLLQENGPLHNRKSKYIAVAVSSNQQKYFVLDCLSGELYVGTKRFKSDGEMMACTPLIRLCLQGREDIPLDGLLLWLEEHLRRLQSGFIKVQRYHCARAARHISLYPEVPPFCSSAVTHGIKVHASAIFLPQISALKHDMCRFVYYCCFRLSFLEACIVDGKHYTSCKIQSFHLTIRTGNDVSHDDWKFDAILRRQSAGEIIYRSYTSASMVPTSIEGVITCVPIRHLDPEGEQFDVKIAPFLLPVPEYIF